MCYTTNIMKIYRNCENGWFPVKMVMSTNWREHITWFCKYFEVSLVSFFGS